MSRDDLAPVDRYYIGGAGLPTAAPGYPFPFETARRFQRIALDWIHAADAYPPVSALAAPTGSGKTAIIAAIAANSRNGAVCTYPTNKLVEEQVAALRAVDGYDLTVERVTGDTLTGRGSERSQNLLNIARSADTDVVVTNPDVLQAIVQNAYYSPGGEVMRFYNAFDAAVFDEFHYYDPLAASGLLTQINVLATRGALLDRTGEQVPPRVLLTSATPDEAFVEHVEADLGIEAQVIRSRLVSLDLSEPGLDRAPRPERSMVYEDGGVPSDAPSTVDTTDEATDPATLVREPPVGVDRFRYPMRIDRYAESIDEAFPSVAERLAVTTAEWTASSGDDPVAAVVFNSAARSNAFQTYLENEWPELAARTQKDNGYDTRAQASTDEPHAVLNTTSKGEVGLDFDLRRLVVAAPWTASAFVQRVGRAARRSPAVVDLYGLDDPTWPAVQSYAGFLARIQTCFLNPETARRQLRQLAGLRAARATAERIEDTTFHPDLRSDFESIPRYDRWNAVLATLDDEVVTEALQATLGGPRLDKAGERVLRAARALLPGLDSLRGRSVITPVTYPLGSTDSETEYDLIRALRHYRLQGRTDDGRIILGGEPSEHLVGYYPGRPLDGDGVDLRESGRQIEARLTEAYSQLADGGDLRDLPVQANDLVSLFHWVPLHSALLPEAIEAGPFRITFDTVRGEVESVNRR